MIVVYYRKENPPAMPGVFILSLYIGGNYVGEIDAPDDDSLVEDVIKKHISEEFNYSEPLKIVKLL